MFQQQVSFGEAISRAFRNYCTFSGRASRSEFWWFFLLSALLCGAVAPFGNIPGNSYQGILPGFVSIILFLPSLGLLFRRLHDAGHTGWWWLISFTGIGVIVLLIFCTQDSQPFTNKYGPVPNLRM